MSKKLVLAYVDSLRSDMLARAVEDGRAPTFAKLLERGVLIEDCVSSFPSVTPVACAEIATGAGATEHWISGMNWYHRLERRYVEYGSSLEATRAFGVFRALYDLVYNMNLGHLNPGVETIFESLDDAGLRTASTSFLIYRGRHRHEVSLDGLLRRAVDASRLKFKHATWGPAELFYGELYASRPVPCKPTSIPGTRDEYAACCGAELSAAGLYDFFLFSLPDNDHFSHRHGPAATVESIERADTAFGRLVEAAGGLDGFLADHALILLADHAQTAVRHRLPLAGELGERWHVLQPSDDQPEDAVLAVSPTSRAGHVYLLREDGPGHREVREAVAEIDGIDLLCWLERGSDPVCRRSPEIPERRDLWAVVRRGEAILRFRPGDEVSDVRGERWELAGDIGALVGAVSDGTFSSHEYPDALTRVWEGLCAPHAGDIVISATPGWECVDWGGAAHVGGGSHGGLNRGDSMGPLLFVGCGPETASAREQWALRDVAPAVREHFGLRQGV